jgi:hypothetical protein
MTVTLAGFETVTRRLTIGEERESKFDIQLTPKGQTETVTVNVDTRGGTDENYGTFYNSVGRLNRIDGDFDF